MDAAEKIRILEEYEHDLRVVEEACEKMKIELDKTRDKRLKRDKDNAMDEEGADYAERWTAEAQELDDRQKRRERVIFNKRDAERGKFEADNEQRLRWYDAQTAAQKRFDEQQKEPTYPPKFPMSSQGYTWSHDDLGRSLYSKDGDASSKNLYYWDEYGRRHTHIRGQMPAAKQEFDATRAAQQQQRIDEYRKLQDGKDEFSDPGKRAAAEELEGGGKRRRNAVSKQLTFDEWLAARKALWRENRREGAEAREQRGEVSLEVAVEESWQMAFTKVQRSVKTLEPMQDQVRQLKYWIELLEVGIKKLRGSGLFLSVERRKTLNKGIARKKALEAALQLREVLVADYLERAREAAKQKWGSVNSGSVMSKLQKALRLSTGGGGDDDSEEEEWTSDSSDSSDSSL